MIQGSPGIGKSTELYGWVQYKTSQPNSTIIYVSFSNTHGYDILVCKEATITRYALENTDLDELVSLLRSLYDEHNPQYMVYDGFTHDNNMIFDAFRLSFDCVVIYCTSYQASRAIKSRDYVESLGICTLSRFQPLRLFGIPNRMFSSEC